MVFAIEDKELVEAIKNSLRWPAFKYQVSLVMKALKKFRDWELVFEGA